MSNRVVLENEITIGRAPKSYWDVEHSRDIEGFATQFSVNAGERVDFKINVNAATHGGAGSDYKVEIFRLGYYGGDGAREVAEWVNSNATVQPDPTIDRTRGLVDAGNWTVTDGWDVPEGAVSGVYLARLQRLDANGDPIDGAVNQIPFVVRNDGAAADIVLQTSDTTWHAYNGWSGKNGQVGANFYGDAGNVADGVNLNPLDDPGPFAQDRAYAVSYNRPFITRGIEGQQGGPAAGAQDYLFGADYAAIHWLEKNGYDVTYISGVDTDRMGTSWFESEDGTNLRKAFISVGHDEYWSGQQRASVEAARGDGVHLLFWSGNEVYWKTRWETSIVDGVEYRTLVCYKETWANGDPNAGPEDYANLDPTDVWTGTWRDSRFASNPLAGANEVEQATLNGLLPFCNCVENALTGQLFGPDGTGEFGAALDVPAPFATLRVWRNTEISNVGLSESGPGELDIAPGILGYEWNTSPEDAFRPSGLIKLSDTTAPWGGILVDQGNRTEPGVATHNLSLYRDPSGALVFGAGTVFWSWGLSDLHDSQPYGADIESADLKQFTVNMFADMGIQPGSIEEGLILATASTDATPATATIDDLPDEVAALSPMLITGTATDDDGDPTTEDGVVAVVEVSFDGGVTWRAAQRLADDWSTWSFAWRPSPADVGEPISIQARAIDDSLNINATPDTEVVTVTSPVPPYTFSLFELATPTIGGLETDDPTVASSGGLELGMRFTVDRAGSITQLRYFRAAADSNDVDTRIGSLWGPDGALLGTATFVSGIDQDGWQIAALAAPVAVTAGVQYVVSYRTNDNYFSSNGFFSPANELPFDGRDDGAFGDFFGVVRAPEDTPTDGNPQNGNGLFRYGAASLVPNQTFESSNYWVDVTFDPADATGNAPPSITSSAAFSTPENTAAVGAVTATDPNGNAIVYAISGGEDAGKFVINATTGALSFRTPPNFEAPTDIGGADGDNVYELVVSVSDGIAAPVTQAITVTLTDLDESTAPERLFPTATPAGGSTDPTDYELGVRFTVNRSGLITELRYFRVAEDASDTDTRTLRLWNAATGQVIGSVEVVSAPDAIGWQVGDIADVAVAAGQTYIASYGYDRDGADDVYAFTSNFFTAPVVSPDGALTAPASGQPVGLSGGGVGNGLFNETVGALPQQSFNAANYWVDVTFADAGPPANTPPRFTGGTAFAADENQTLAATLTAEDDEGQTLTFGIAGGDDASRFIIDAGTGVLRFDSAPDFEAPDDAGGNGVYNLVVSVSDGVAPPVERAIAVTLADVDETTPPAGSTLFGDATPTAFETRSADPTNYELGTRFAPNSNGLITALRYFRGAEDDNDVDVRTLTLWDVATGDALGSAQVSSGIGATGWQVATLTTPIAVTAGRSYIVSYGYVIGAAGEEEAYAVTRDFFDVARTSPDGSLTASAGTSPENGGNSDGTGNGVFSTTPGALPTGSFDNSAYFVDVIFTPDAPPSNDPPVFTSPSTFMADENQVLVGPVSVSDPDGPSLVYALSGADAAAFAIDQATGLLRFVAPPDFETKAAYALTISASDGVNPAVAQDVTVTVADVDETPDGDGSLEGRSILAQYIFGTSEDAVFDASSSQTATVGAGVEFPTLPTAGPDVGNGPFGLVSIDIDGAKARIAFPLDPALLPQQDFVRLAGAADQRPFNGVRLADAGGTLPTILGARIIGQQGFTTDQGALRNLTAAELTVGPDSIFLNVAGLGRRRDVDAATPGDQAAYVDLLLDLNDAPEILVAAEAIAIAEGATLVAELSATDEDAGQTPVLSISGGEDAALFELIGGSLRFVTAPDFEAPPADAGDPGYEVTVRADDGFGGVSEKSIVVTVTDVPDNPPNRVVARVGGTGTSALPPRFEVIVDGASLGAFNVAAPVATFDAAADSSFADFELLVEGAAPRRVDIVFLNDGPSGVVNRDLYVDYIEVNGVRFETETFATSLFTNAQGPQAVAGREAQFRNGTMRFDNLPVTSPIEAPPEIAPIDDLAVNEGEAAAFTVSASDPNGDVISLSVTVANVDTGVALDPSRYVFADNGGGSGDFLFLPNASEAGTYLVTVTASDGVGQTTETAQITVADVPDSPVNTLVARIGGTGTAALPPRFEVIVDGLSLGQFAVAAPLVVFDVADDASFADFAFSVSGAPPRRVDIVFLNDGLSGAVNRDLVVDYIEVNGVRLETETFAASLFTNAQGPQAVTGREAQFRNGTMRFDDLPAVEPGNVAPVIDPIEDVSVAEGTSAQFTVAAADADGDPIALSATVVNVATGDVLSPGRYSFVDEGDGEASFRFDTGFNDAGVYGVVVLASDGARESTRTATVTVTDAAPPTSTTVVARIGGTGAAGAPPRFEVRFDGVSFGQFEVVAPVAVFDPADDAQFSDFTFLVAGDAPQQAEIIFLNDGLSGAVNRDLWIDYIEIEGARFETEAFATSLFTNAQGPQAVAGREAMFRNGTMLFDNLLDL